ncbi:hypothetical protein GE09DRAFT_948904 [Coniochaeta sp. 2T2.1]|nr:hypothetical protein GE09DRAFT_948904 [Coniochaeta sp. 2T2.1]
MSTRKRPRQSESAPTEPPATEQASEQAIDQQAECPFTAQIVNADDRLKKKNKRRRTGSSTANDPDLKIQQSPFHPAGSFKTNKTLDAHYRVDPAQRWNDMTRYNSFVLNGVKYFTEDYVYVANDESIARQKALANSEGKSTKSYQRSSDDWTARVLEIRASDEHHVYARLYWMYSPDELPKETKEGGKAIKGRQPYHGNRELVASNHMDIINVVSVTGKAAVDQIDEEDDERTTEDQYWRQALDIRTWELSSLLSICKCNKPSNPDEKLVGCSTEACNKWLHMACIKHDALMRVYNELGTSKPHVSKASGGKAETNADAQPASSAGAAAQESIGVDTSAVKDDGANGDASAPATGRKSAESEKRDSATPVPGTSRGGGRTKKGDAKTNGVAKNNDKPYEGLFDVEVVTEPQPLLVFKDLREGVTGGDKEWTEPMKCLVCGDQIV